MLLGINSYTEPYATTQSMSLPSTGQKIVYPTTNTANKNMQLERRKAIYILTEKSKWDSAKNRGIFIDESLHEIGFIHSMNYDEILAVANAFYLNRQNLVLLQIDPQKSKSEIKFEEPHVKLAVFKKGDKFPHIYGPLNIDAVVSAIPVSKNKVGQYDAKSLKLVKPMIPQDATFKVS